VISPSVCLLCHTPSTTDPIQRGTLLVHSCPNCGLNYGETDEASATLEAGSVDTSPHHFSTLLTQSEALAPALAGLVEGRMAAFVKRLGEKPRHWLEIGPGSGLLSAIVTRHGGSWRGCEIDADMAAEMMARGLDVVQADFSAIDPASLFTHEVAAQGGFDMLFLSQVFEHVRNPDRFLENAFGALRPGGVIYIDVPNDGGLTAIIRRLNKWGGTYGEVVPPYHMIAYGAKTLGYALEQAGFEKVSVSTAAYNHAVYGLAHARIHRSPKFQTLWMLSGIVGLGGNLVAMAQRPLGGGDAAAC